MLKIKLKTTILALLGFLIFLFLCHTVACFTVWGWVNPFEILMSLNKQPQEIKKNILTYIIISGFVFWVWWILNSVEDE